MFLGLRNHKKQQQSSSISSLSSVSSNFYHQPTSSFNIMGGFMSIPNQNPYLSPSQYSSSHYSPSHYSSQSSSTQDEDIQKLKEMVVEMNHIIVK